MYGPAVRPSLQGLATNARTCRQCKDLSASRQCRVLSSMEGPAVDAGPCRPAVNACSDPPSMERPATVGTRVDPLLLLPTIAEPDLDDLAVHLQSVRHRHDLLDGRLRVLEEVLFQRQSDAMVDVSPLLPPASQGLGDGSRAGGADPGTAEATRPRGHGRGRSRRLLTGTQLHLGVVLLVGDQFPIRGGRDVVQPFLKEWLQLAHVLEAEVERLESRYGRLAEVVAVQLSHRQADVTLGESWEDKIYTII